MCTAKVALARRLGHHARHAAARHRARSSIAEGLNFPFTVQAREERFPFKPATPDAIRFDCFVPAAVARYRFPSGYAASHFEHSSQRTAMSEHHY